MNRLTGLPEDLQYVIWMSYFKNNVLPEYMNLPVRLCTCGCKNIINQRDDYSVSLDQRWNLIWYQWTEFNRFKDGTYDRNPYIEGLLSDYDAMHIVDSDDEEAYYDYYNYYDADNGDDDYYEEYNTDLEFVIHDYHNNYEQY
jgi:hypothetical protein